MFGQPPSPPPLPPPQQVPMLHREEPDPAGGNGDSPNPIGCITDAILLIIIIIVSIAILGAIIYALYSVVMQSAH